MKLEELFGKNKNLYESENQTLTEGRQDQWDIKVDDSHQLIRVMGNISLSANVNWMEIYVDVLDELSEQGYSKEEISQVRRELRDELDEMKTDDSFQEEAEKISTVMHGLLSSLVQETAQNREQKIKEKWRAIAEGNKKNEI